METELRLFRERLGVVQAAICDGVKAVGVRIEPRHFVWNSGVPLEAIPERISVRIQLGPYRCFEQTFTREQIELGRRDPTVEAYIALAIERLTKGGH